VRANWRPDFDRPPARTQPSWVASGTRSHPQLLALIEYLGSAQRSVDSRATPVLDPARILPHISKQGVKFTNVNREPREVFLTLAELRRQLRLRSGAGFVAFAHIGYLYSDAISRFPDEEAAAVSVYESSALVMLGSYYVLEFAQEDGAYRLIGCDYLQEERE
jgi:hypothetical protein